MTTPGYVLSRAVEHDLAHVFDWIARETGPHAAEGALRRIGRKFEMLAEAPSVGRVRGDLAGAPRTFAVWPWIIFYAPLTDGAGVLILRVLDGRRDLQRR